MYVSMYNMCMSDTNKPMHGMYTYVCIIHKYVTVTGANMHSFTNRRGNNMYVTVDC